MNVGRISIYSGMRDLEGSPGHLFAFALAWISPICVFVRDILYSASAMLYLSL